MIKLVRGVQLRIHEHEASLYQRLVLQMSMRTCLTRKLRKKRGKRHQIVNEFGINQKVRNNTGIM